MYLKRLELHGFKSFAPRTVLEFSPGITAIVGPNGSGKSNVADGIRWVLGEQSMRQLRGKRSDDVIFAGGQGRATAQMAEVGLVLDNSAGWLPSEFAEVTVARRSFRSGDSEYLANGQRVRLRDVLLLLAQARIGHDSYTVIGQGLVDQALSLRAEERPALFEDAAGIRQFQAQRNEAEQKLALTQGNLSRLRDILGEIEPRLAPLAEQARRAREFAGSACDLTRLLRQWYRRQWADLQTTSAVAEAAERDFAGRIAALQTLLSEQDTSIAALRQEREDLLGQIVHLRRERRAGLDALQTAERELAVARERLASVEQQQRELGGEQEQQEDAIIAGKATPMRWRPRWRRRARPRQPQPSDWKGLSGQAMPLARNTSARRRGCARRNVMSFRRRRGSVRHRQSWDDYNANWASVTVRSPPGMRRLRSFSANLRHQNRRWPDIGVEFERCVRPSKIW